MNPALYDVAIKFCELLGHHATPYRLLSFGVALLGMLFHDGASSHFLCARAITPAPLRTLFDVLVLALLFLADASEMFLARHEIVLPAGVVQLPSQSPVAVPIVTGNLNLA